MHAHARRLLAWSCAAAGLAVADARAEPLFAVTEHRDPGRTPAADIVDVDGDGRGDLLSISFDGIPPRERREVRLRYQRPDGSLPEEPDWVGLLASDAVAYDLADLDADPGSELLLLRRDRITALSFPGREPRVRDIPVPGAPLLSVAPDERGMDRLRLVRSDLGEPPLLLVPGLGDAAVLDASGAVVGRPAVGSRANYFIPPRPGPMIGESEIELYFDFPRVNAGDVDGDGRADLISSHRHELRVFLRRPDGRFATEPDRVAALGLVSESDHIRSSGAVRIDTGDFDGDGRVDLLISNAAGGIFDATTESTVHLNRDGDWNLAEPDQVFRTEGGLTTSQLLDLDGDGRPELLDLRIPLSVVEVVEVLLTRSIDANLRAHRALEDGRFDEKPWLERKFGVSMSFETFRPRGFLPTFEHDLNGDGRRDLFSSGDGDALEVYLGGEDAYRKRHRQKGVDTGGRMRTGDFDGDGLADFVLYDARRPGTPIRLGVNQGRLPGSRPRPSLEATPPADAAGTPAATPDPEA